MTDGYARSMPALGFDPTPGFQDGNAAGLAGKYDAAGLRGIGLELISRRTP